MPHYASEVVQKLVPLLQHAPTELLRAHCRTAAHCRKGRLPELGCEVDPAVDEDENPSMPRVVLIGEVQCLCRADAQLEGTGPGLQLIEHAAMVIHVPVPSPPEALVLAQLKQEGLGRHKRDGACT